MFICFYILFVIFLYSYPFQTFDSLFVWILRSGRFGIEAPGSAGSASPAAEESSSPPRHPDPQVGYYALDEAFLRSGFPFWGSGVGTLDFVFQNS